MPEPLDQEQKRENASIDDQLQRGNSLLESFKMLVLVMLVSIAVWFVCALMRECIDIISAEFINKFSMVWGKHDPSVDTIVGISNLNKVQAAKNMQASFMKLHPSALWNLTLLIFWSAIVRAILVHWSSWRRASGDGVMQSLKRFHNTYKVTTPRAEARYLRVIYAEHNIINAFQRVFMTILTLSGGGSGGLEGPIVPVGDRIGCGLSRIFKISEMDDMRALVMAGISAGIATLLQAPLTAALFSAEIVFAGSIRYRKLCYSLLAAVVAYELNRNFLSHPPLFIADAHEPNLVWQSYIEVTVLALFVCAPAGYIFKRFLKRLRKLFERMPEIVRAPLAAILLVGIVYTLWFRYGLEPYHILGLGEHTIAQIFEGYGNPMLQVGWVLIILVLAKMLATGLTLVSGGSAGILVPSMYLGALTGAGVFYGLQALGVPLTNITPDFYMVVGLASSLVAVAAIPLATIAFVLEIFGIHYGPPAIIAVVLCHVVVRAIDQRV